MSILSKIVNHHKYTVCMTRSGKPLHKIKRYNLPCLSWDVQRLQQSWQFRPVRFSLLADHAGFHKVAHCFFHSFPSKHFLHPHVSHWYTRMAPKCTGMTGSQQLLLQHLICTYPNSILYLNKPSDRVKLGTDKGLMANLAIIDNATSSV